MRKFALFLVITIGISACASTPSDQSANGGVAESSPAEATAATSDKKRCRRDSSTGSRLGSKRVCD